MPNWCYNQTIIYGDKNKTYELGQKLLEHYEKIEKHTFHFSVLFEILGCPQDLCPNVRAWVNYVQIKEDNSLFIEYESAWNPIIKDLDKVLEEYQPTLKQVTLAEETGMAIFVNTDIEGLYFTEQYYLDISIYGDDNDDRFNDFKYFDTLEDVINEFKTFFEIEEEINTIEELREWIGAMKDGFKECYITFEEFSLE